MKKLLAILLLLPSLAFAQTAARFDLPVLTTTPAQVPVGSLPDLLAVTNATIAVCGYPATMSGGMCTNTITTYTDSTLATACPSTAQLTAPGTSVCISTTGLQGAFGFWYDSSANSHLTYTVKTSWGTYGPYDIAVSGGSVASYSVKVNGTAVPWNPNFNGSTPAPDSGYTAATFKVSGQNVIAEVPTGGSSDCGAGIQCVPYNASNTNYIWTSASLFIVSTQNEVTATAVSCDGTNCMITAPQSYTAGQPVQFAANSGWSPSCLNWMIGTVLSTGLSSTQFEVSETGLYGSGGGTACTGTQTGTGGSVQDASYFWPFAASKLPFFNGHGTVIDQGIPGGTSTDMVNKYATGVHPYTTAVTGKPSYVIVMPSGNDWGSGIGGNCFSLATEQSNLGSLMASAHTDGAKVIAISGPSWPNQGPSCTNGSTIYLQTNAWLRAQGKTSSHIASGKYWDYFIDAAQIFNDFNNANYRITTTFNQFHFNDSGNAYAAQLTNAALALQGSTPMSFSDCNPDGITSAIYTPCVNMANTFTQTNNFTTSQEITGVNGAWLNGEAFRIALGSSGSMSLGAQNGYGLVFANSGYFAALSPSINSMTALILGNNTGYCFSNSNGVWITINAFDTCLTRDSAGVMDLGNASSYTNSSGSLKDQFQIFSGTATDPASPVNGTMWYDSTNNLLKARINGTTQSLGGGAIYPPAGIPQSTGSAWGTSLGTSGTGTSVILPSGTAASGDYVDGSTKAWTSLPVQSISATSPITATNSAGIWTIACPTCGSSTGGTNVSLNSGSSLGSLGISSFMPTPCSDTSGSGTAQSCTTSPSFTPQTNNCLLYTTTTANSGTGLTINVNALGAKSIAIPGSSGWTTTLTAGVIPANKPVPVCYDGTNWNVMQTGTAFAGVYPFTGFTTPNTTGWSWINQGTSSVSVNNGVMTQTSTGTGSDQIRYFYTSLPATPWTLTFALLPTTGSNWPSNPGTPASYSGGVCLSDGTKFEAAFTMEGGTNTAVSVGLQIAQYTNTTTFSTSAYTASFTTWPTVEWVKIHDDGTNRVYYMSGDPVNTSWHQIYSEAHTNFITPTTAGMCSDYYGSAMNGITMTGQPFVSWSLTTP